MMGPVQPTPFDLYFPLFGIPVRVVPTFWLGGALFGSWMIRESRFDLLLIWLAVLFVSILIHEIGHAVVIRRFGWDPRVFLYHFGGVAIYEPYHGHTTGRAMAVAFAGPAAGFLFYGAVVGTEAILNTRGIRTNVWEDPLGFAFIQLKFLNLWWGLVNLLPVLPLDGGRICEALCHRYLRRGSPVELTYKIGLMAGIAAAVYFLGVHERFFGHKETYAGILFALLALHNFQGLQAYRGGRYW